MLSLLKSCAKKIRPLFVPILVPIIRYPIRYSGHETIKWLLWRWLVVPFFQYASYNYVAKTAFDSAISGNTSDMIQRYIYYFGVWEPNLTQFLNHNLKDGDVFVDVGAHIGYFTLQASKLVGKSGKVVAIEASPKAHAKLIENIERERATNIEALNIAVSDKEETLKIFLAPINTGETSILPAKDYTCECEVTAKPLSAIIPRHEISKVRLIKIDVEGAEWFVVSGLRPLDRK